MSRPSDIPPVPMDTRHAAQARSARAHYVARMKDLHVALLTREVRALLNDLRRLFEVTS
jgi:hypothetical protein